MDKTFRKFLKLENKEKVKFLLVFFYKISFRKCYETYHTPTPIKIIPRIKQLMRMDSTSLAYWPVHPNSVVGGAKYIKIGIGTAPGMSFGNYIFAKEDSPIYIGDYSIFAPNVCLAGYNHDIYNYRQYPSKGGIKIGDYCWIAINCAIMPGVELGDHTIVAANSVVTKSFIDGYCVIGGNPARLIKKLDPNKCIKYKNEFEYYGFIEKLKFEAYRKKYLRV